MHARAEERQDFARTETFASGQCHDGLESRKYHPLHGGVPKNVAPTDMVSVSESNSPPSGHLL
jgi:hypothetical protein